MPETVRRRERIAAFQAKLPDGDVVAYLFRNHRFDSPTSRALAIQCRLPEVRHNCKLLLHFGFEPARHPDLVALRPGDLSARLGRNQDGNLDETWRAPLIAYMLAHHDISYEQERELIRRVQQDGNAVARQELTGAMLGGIFSIARRLEGPSADCLELESVGTLAVMAWINKFNLSRISSETGRSPRFFAAAKLVARRAMLKYIARTKRHCSSVSLDTAGVASDHPPLTTVVSEDPSSGASAAAERVEVLEKIFKAADLSARDLQMIKMRYGLSPYQKAYDPESIAEAVKLSVHRVNWLLSQTRRRIRLAVTRMPRLLEDQRDLFQ